VYIRMAEEGTELLIPLNEGERDNVAILIEPVEEVRVCRELYEDRYWRRLPSRVKKRSSNSSKIFKR